MASFSRLFSPTAKFAKFAATTMAATTFSLGIMAPPAKALDLGQLLMQGLQVMQLNNVSDSQDVTLGGQIHARMLQNGDFRLANRPQLTAQINQIGQRLARVSNRPSLPFQFFVVEDDAVNAFATTGGYVYITTGAVQAADNEAQVAAILAHEIAHITQRHVIQQLQRSALASAGAQALGLNNSGLAAAAIDLGVRRPRSREFEFEADQEGLFNLHRAGYDPRAMPDFLGKLLRRGNPPTFLSTHPPTQERINRLEALIAQHNLTQGRPSTQVEIQPGRPPVQQLR